jgi:hypothetical protein
VHWLLELLAPRTIARNAARQEKVYGVDTAIIQRSRKALEKSLRGGGRLTRAGVYEVLERAKIDSGSQRGLQIIWRLAHDGLLCFGAREGKQQTFVLLDEWIRPPHRSMEPDEALAELARRYFVGHGPATHTDLAWWAGLTTADAKRAAEAAAPQLQTDTVDGKRFYFVEPSEVPSHKGVFLFPAFDEYIVGYRDRSAVIAAKWANRFEARNGMLEPTVVVGGQVVGTWKRALSRKAVEVTPTLFRPLSKTEEGAFEDAVGRYASFLGLAC